MPAYANVVLNYLSEGTEGALVEIFTKNLNIYKGSAMQAVSLSSLHKRILFSSEMAGFVP